MTETTQMQTMPSRGGGSPSSPEFRVAMDAWRRLRQDLFHDGFAYRPMAPMKMDGLFTSRLSGRVRDYVAWAPHAVVVVAGLLSMAIAASASDAGGLGAMVAAGFALLPVLLTMIRPVAAFWVSLIAAPVTAVGSGLWDDWPWTAGSFATHLVVMTVVALRTRPRVAAWMWGLTAAYGAFLETILGDSHYASNNTVPLLVVSAMSLLAASALTIRRTAQREVTAQQTVTEHERSRRTLLEERTTIARELHDVVAHHMSVVAIQAEAAPYRVENPPPELEQAFATIRENAVAALTELRRVLGVVRAEDYEAPDAPQPTLADLDGLLANVREAGLTVDKAVTGAVRELPQGVELSAYRIVQEALSNTLRHAPGAAARVEIGYVLGGLGLRIVNGASPEVSLVKSTHGTGHGLTGMRERVTMLNGEMTTGETADGGYEVTVFLPVSSVSETDA
ncbi:sensor histidine kinase [Streptomyces stelliscabiei]|uniref:sensor histidine kinase n=1 Tax=Streptomyces stelliscabiei TaxID=146820 RepID=UPI0029B66602|nr:histidine kinase [Streptomyces stelliscabiei]MDX2553785.1 histidine kinase [Streptomyces stelliscabiei]MDX2617254.1 histidine kinase [Streptomyces stelliscabiei]MDX2637918.1 histidine kinase [Streptomyces stelliscabiei]MDX2667451.1 histidine kinase [Streptomyces stelliscabiei]MDX2718039.1 histidine kinase [Streptomyces stelliscabiei]